ncbi:MAG: porin family protein, partial [Acidobacteriota bacterium]|nr:porin family protein [Acidobacteriota bacterium]
MKKFLCVAGLLMIVAIPAWGGGLGVMASTWDTDQAGGDEGVGFKIDLDLGGTIDLELRATWLNEFAFATQGRQFKLEAMPLDFGLSYGFHEDRKVSPYVGGGLSFVFLNGSTAGGGPLRVDDEAGYYVVGGFDATVSERLGVFAEVLFRDVSAEFTGDGLLNRDFTDFGADLGGVGA